MGEEKKSSKLDSARTYEVGYRNPPKHSQFKPGQSGNVRGRPAGTKNLKTDLLEELSEKIAVREGSSTRQVTKQRGLVKSLVARGLKGNERAILSALSMRQRLEDSASDALDHDQSLSEDEFEVLRGFVERRDPRAAMHEEPESEREPEKKGSK